MTLIDIISNIAYLGVKDKELCDAEIDEIVIREGQIDISFADEYKNNRTYYLDE